MNYKLECGKMYIFKAFTVVNYKKLVDQESAHKIKKTNVASLRHDYILCYLW